MNENLNAAPETIESGKGRRANPSWYLDRKSATVLMIIKLAEGLSELCLAILGAFVLQTFIAALNRIFQEGSTIADGKAMVAQFLHAFRVPAETIQQVIDAIPTDIRFSSRPVVYMFLAFLPFVLIAVLEAVAAIRLRLGKGGTRTIGILQMIYFVLGVIRMIALVVTAVVLSIFLIVNVGGTGGILISAICIGLTLLFILISVPTLLYHRKIAKLMDDVGYELETGLRAVRKQSRFDMVLTILIVFEVIGAVVSILASSSSLQSGFGAAMLVGALLGPAAKLLKYICVKFCYGHFMEEETAEASGPVSHTPQIVLAVLVTLLFIVPNIFLCTQSGAFSTAMAEAVEDYFSKARETVNELSIQVESQIAAAESQAAAVQSAVSAQGAAAAANTAQDAAAAGSAGTEAASGAVTVVDGGAEAASSAAAEGAAGVAAAAEAEAASEAAVSNTN